MREGKARPSGIRLSVFASKKLLKDVEDVEVNLQTCGRLNGVSGNKGGINVNLRVGDTSIAFIACHLNAHMEELERRNQDYRTINAGLHPSHLEFEQPEGMDDLNLDDTREIEVANRHDVVFFFGDLNYRLEPPQSGALEIMCEEVLLCIREQDWRKLMQYDQLRTEQTAGRIFHGYNESAINFAPTFKFSKKKTDPDPAVRYNLKRVPSYCDRILYKEVGKYISR